MATETILTQHIEITPNVASGKPRITGHRITVQNIVIWHEWMRLSADEIAAEYNLELSDVYAALAYYYDHREQINECIRTDEAFVEELRKKTHSKVTEKLSGLKKYAIEEKGE